MNIRMVFASFALVAAMAARAERAELVWTLEDGSKSTESVEMSEADGSYKLRLAREAIVAKGAKFLSVTPSFARAKKGDAGFWFSPYGQYGEWDCDSGSYVAANESMNMPMYGWKTPRGAFLAVITSLKCYPRLAVRAEKGEYAVSCELTDMLCRRPYEDLEIVFRRYPADATYVDLARGYREYQLGRGAVKPLRERVRDNPVLKQAVESPEIRIRQGWKPVPSPVSFQCPENEPEMKSVVTFDRVRDIVRELKAQGVPGAELCLVGWNVGGHDGRYPQVFPVEPRLGGQAKLCEAIKATLDAGYLIVPHGNFRDCYTVADTWDGDIVVKDENGEIKPDRGGKLRWGGGLPFVLCPQRAYEKYCFRDMPRIAALGFKGMGYFDVVSILHATECLDPRHPCSCAKGAEFWGKCAEISKREFGGFASEGSVDHFAGSLDSVLYASFADPRNIAAAYAKGRSLAKRHIPVFQIAYNGIIVQNPFTFTVNFTAQPRYAQLKLLEYGGRPNFYFYSKFVSDGTDWMGKNDLGCGTEEQLKWSVSRIKEGADIYERLKHLQYEFVENHEAIAEGVFRTTWANGDKIVVNYNDSPVKADGVGIGAMDYAFIPAARK
ncbi:MAG: hypothetical protein IJI73_02080 [Kiritimatiellae bacterium]|nr:hypothetical protein [Kiritimatiellia bacterium]